MSRVEGRRLLELPLREPTVHTFPSKRWITVEEKQKVDLARRLGQPFLLLGLLSLLGQLFSIYYKHFGSLSWVNLGKALRQSDKLHKRFLRWTRLGRFLFFSGQVFSIKGLKDPSYSKGTSTTRGSVSV